MMWATRLPTFVVLLQMALSYKTSIPKGLHQLSSPLPLVRHKPHLQEATNSASTYESVIRGDFPPSLTGQIFHSPNQIPWRLKKPQETQSFLQRYGPTAASHNNLVTHHTDLNNYDSSSTPTASSVERQRFQQPRESSTLLLKPIPAIASLNPSDTTQPVTIGANRNVKQSTFRQVNSKYDESSESKQSLNRSLGKAKAEPGIDPKSTSFDKDSNYLIPTSFSPPTSPIPAMAPRHEQPALPSKNGPLEQKYAHRFRSIRSLDKGCHSQHLKTCGSNVIKEFSAGIVSLSSKCQIRKEFLDCMVQQREIECAPETSPVSPQDTEPIRNKVTNLLRTVNGCLLL